MSEFQDKLDQLKAPFPEADIQWRIITSGEKNGNPWAIVAPYIDNRAIMERLDEVIGAENWKNALTETSKGAYCGIFLRINNEWIDKWDGADSTAIEPTKGEVSDSMKRAGVHWGIGRYLYELPKPMFANISPNGKNSGSYKDKQTNKTVWFKWDAPKLPSWALPKNTPQTSQEAPHGTKDKKEDTGTGLSKKDIAFKVAFAPYYNTSKTMFMQILGSFGYENPMELSEKDRVQFLKELELKIEVKK